MTLTVAHQERYSRGQLILRTLFGFIYITIPHGVILLILSIWSAILAFITFWAVLFTGRFPRGIFDYQVKLNRWSARVQASLSNLVDGYPSFGLNASSDKVTFDVPYPERVSRGLVILRLLFGGIYVMIPHGICLIGRAIAAAVIMLIAWFAVLITGTYPARWHEFVVGTYRWSMRVSMYLGYFTDSYPAFSGKA